MVGEGWGWESLQIEKKQIGSKEVPGRIKGVKGFFCSWFRWGGGANRKVKFRSNHDRQRKGRVSFSGCNGKKELGKKGDPSGVQKNQGQVILGGDPGKNCLFGGKKGTKKRSKSVHKKKG